ncbi:MAG: FHA domain-containing protein [Planctomycetales bacterium]
MALRLKILTGESANKVLSVDKSRVLVGRGKECDIRPACERVSRIHCQISVADQGVWINDLNSANGTFINGIPVSGPRQLKLGDQLEVGTLIIEMVGSPDDAAETPKPSQTDSVISILDELPHDSATQDGTHIATQDEVAEFHELLGLDSGRQKTIFSRLKDQDESEALIQTITQSIESFRRRHPKITDDFVIQTLKQMAGVEPS